MIRRAAFALMAVAACALADAQSPPIVPIPGIEVIGTTPLPGFGTPEWEVPGNVQVFSGREIGRQRPLDLAAFLEQNPSSVNVNTTSGNPFQNDVNFRGFTASPLLGTPQGLSVLLDGVRINEVFGEVVNWDLIPTNAIASIQVIPGSHPVFGLNTLGGALAIYTKNGIEYPGTTIDVMAGSFGRRAVSFETGNQRDALDWFIAGNLLDEDGWRDHSPSSLRQLFGKLGYQGIDTEINASATIADTRLSGTQALPVSMLNGPAQAYTWPDTTDNRLAFFNLRGTRLFGEKAVLSGGLYYRHVATDGFNSNINGDYDPDAMDSPPAFNVVSGVVSTGKGATVQLSLLAAPGGFKNRFAAGLAIDLGDTSFVQSQQPATITDSRETTGTGAFSSLVDVGTTTRKAGVYATDTLALSDRVSTTLSARYDDARITIRDRSGIAPELNGDHTFRRLNPAAGVTILPVPSTTLYANWSQGLRAPSPVELTCANPNAPCTLPNIFVADPPLLPVIATTVELGARGRWNGSGFWSAAVYRTDLTDDIQFVAAGNGAANSGFFQNIGRTRRVGVELGAGATVGAMALSARYSHTSATYQTEFLENSPNNSTANTDGDILVRAGDRLPNIPSNLLKLRAVWDATPALAVGTTIIAASRLYARGNENNRDAGGTVPGYAVMNIDLRYTIGRQWTLLANAANVLDRHYQNFGILGVNYFRGANNAFDPGLAAPETFRSPASPFGVWIGVKFTFADK